MTIDEIRQVDEKEESENLFCYLCKTTFEDQESLYLHKRDHLIESKEHVSSCTMCDTSFVNAICLEAHMQTHFKIQWNYDCKMCSSKFPEDILLKSHIMSHGIPAPTISSVNRYKSQLHENKTDISSVHENESSSNSLKKINDSECKEPDSSGLISLQIPIQIKTAEVTTTQPGTPIAITSTDSDGENYIQLIPVQLIPAKCDGDAGILLNDTETDNTDCVNSTPNNSIENSYYELHNNMPKISRKLPDLIPISKFNINNTDDHENNYPRSEDVAQDVDDVFVGKNSRSDSAKLGTVRVRESGLFSATMTGNSLFSYARCSYRVLKVFDFFFHVFLYF